jgi:Holliday junction resolvase RusA-like endonuclease
MHFLYAPLKAFHKEKGKMEAIRNGKKYYKNTRPDLPDNMKKLVNDAMSELVYKDDSIIVSEDDVKKYYSVGGCVIIVLEGY